MPIEIKELVIRTVVTDGSPTDSPASPSAAATAGDATDDAIVQACVREVLRILNQRRER